MLEFTGRHPTFVFAELGLLSWRLDADKYETDENLKKIREARGYSYVVCIWSFLLLFVLREWAKTEQLFDAVLFSICSGHL